MGLALIHVVLLLNLFEMKVGNPIHEYRFDVYPVETCPMNATEFEKAARRRNCTEKLRYLCAPDKYLSNLIEFCTDRRLSLFQNGNCLRLDGTGDLNHFRCAEKFKSGCPTNPYTDEEIYKNPACLLINTKSNCFVADDDCQMRHQTSTKTYNTKAEDNNENASKVFHKPSGVSLAIIVLYFVLIVAIGTAIIMNHLWKKDKKDDVESVEETLALAHDYPFKGKKGDEDQTTIKIPSEIINNRDINQSIKTDIEKTNVSIEIGDDKDLERTELQDINEKEKYKYFWNRHQVFSHWYPCIFVIGGKTYHCVEQYMMYKKAELMGDDDIAAKIMILDEPKEIKQHGRKVKNFDNELWEKHCQEIVEKGNMAKFSQNIALKEKLISTYPKILVESCPKDKIWGIGLSQDDERAWNESTWQGENLLGKILVKVRKRLKDDSE